MDAVVRQLNIFTSLKNKAFASLNSDSRNMAPNQIKSLLIMMIRCVSWLCTSGDTLYNPLEIMLLAIRLMRTIITKVNVPSIHFFVYAP